MIFNKRILITLVVLVCLLISLFEIRLSLGLFFQTKAEENNYIYEEKMATLAEEKKEMRAENTQIEFRGIDFYPSPYIYATLEAFNALEELLQLEGINYVQLRVFLYQDSLTSNQVVYDEKQDIVLESMITMIHQAGKKVSLLPDIIVKTGGYVADLAPKDIEQWFASYTDFLIRYAGLAQAYEVELFCIGNEFHSLWGSEQKWKQTIQKLRSQYQGLISVKLNCWWQEETFKRVLTFDWLKDLDLIAIAPYFDLTKKPNPTLEELEKAWFNSRHDNQNVVRQLETISDVFGKKILFSEIGYRSTEGASMEPWNNEFNVPRGLKGRAIYSDKEQALATQALFNVFEGQDWWDGVFWFYWPTAKPNEGDRSWAIWNKPVEKVIQNNFTK
ncbi:MAG: hypothetical protein PHF45_02295 [Candidatus Pacebacteria bacterium]|nr:hypothetical protein [Candidatus Paceibacterota bacterium]